MRKNYGPLYTAPLAGWITLFLMVPICIIFIYSFLTKGLYGGVEWIFSLKSYAALANPSFVSIAISTAWIAIAATIIAICLALPTAYFIARSKHKTVFLFLIIIPFWTNFLIRIYAWITILGNNGFVNSILMQTGLIHLPIGFLYNQWAVICVLVYVYLPFAILPLYAVIEKFDFSLLEAARDLGATKMQAIRKVLFPNIRSGITTAVLFTFIPAFGNYAVPQLIGGRDSYMLGTVIARELTVTRNWPLSASISVVITIMTMVAVFLFMRGTLQSGEKNHGK